LNRFWNNQSHRQNLKTVDQKIILNIYWFYNIFYTYNLNQSIEYFFTNYVLNSVHTGNKIKLMDSSKSAITIFGENVILSLLHLDIMYKNAFS